MSAVTQNRQTPSITLELEFIGKITGRKIVAQALIDSGAEGIIINARYANQHHFTLIPLSSPFPVRNVDGTDNVMGWVRHYTVQRVRIYSRDGHSYHEELVELYVTDIGDHDVILGTDWLDEHNPEIDWAGVQVDFTRCPDSCILKNPPVTDVRAHAKRIPIPAKRPPHDPRLHHRDYQVQWKDREGILRPVPVQRTAGQRRSIRPRVYNRVQIPVVLFTEDDDEEEEVPREWEEQMYTQVLRDDYPRPVRDSQPSDGPSIQIRAGFSKAQELAEASQKPKDTRPLAERIPSQYHAYLTVFDKHTSDRLPEHSPWDHAIDLKPGFQPKPCKTYPLSVTEQAELDAFLDENLAKGYIRPSKSPMASPFFFVKKKDGKLRPVQDYRELNKGTIKNEYPLPLIAELIDKLKGARYFSKVDLRQGFNNCRLKDGHEWKAAFKTNRGLFEPLVMFFGLMNSPATFQAMMNTILKDLIDSGKVVVYMDDILIFTETLEEHRKIVLQVLQRLKEHDLYAKPEKCTFEAESIEFLGLIISHNEIRMDPVKVDGVANWPLPRNVKDVQSFLGFGNFYRRFIEGFSRVARPLFDLTKKDEPWIWTPDCQEAFQALKDAFTSSPVLIMPNPDKPYRVEVDASDYATGGILSQTGDDNQWHPVAYISKSLSEPQRNYDIHDKELLAIIRALEAWRQYLEGSAHPVDVLTDHKNLEYFTNSQKLSRRQARWALFLTRFDFTLTHKPGTQNHSDPLSRRADHKEGVEDDNTDRVLLDPKFFRIRATRPGEVAAVGDVDLRRRIRECPNKDAEVRGALEVILRNGPRSLVKNLQEWNYEDGLVLFRGKVYVPDDLQLRRDIVKMHHDLLGPGHPGRFKTYELLSREFWWPGMSVFVRDYVDGCATCQMTKPRNHPAHVPLVPNEVPERPFGTITTDFITDLPECDGYNAIHCVVDRFTKTVIVSPCRKTIDADGTVDILVNGVYRRYGLWDKMISDRGPQFASKVMQAVHAKLGITSALSTAYHPQTDGETERYNQELEQYLRVFCNYRQDDWVKYLPFAEFSHNSRIHSATGKSPFELLHGFKPRLYPSLNPTSNIPSVEDRLTNLERLREEVQASLTTAAEIMKRNNGDVTKKGITFKVGDKVLLDGKNLKTTRPKAKLSDKHHGPFEVTDVLGPVNYRLKLPPTWRIHPVFHAALLLPYVETEAHGPNFPSNPPELIDDKEEYDVETILDSRATRNKRGVQYLVKWLDYPSSDNSWEPSSNLTKALPLIEEFHRRHPNAYSKPLPRLRTLGVTVNDIWARTSALQAQAHPKEGVLSRIASILLPPSRVPHSRYRHILPSLHSPRPGPSPHSPVIHRLGIA